MTTLYSSITLSDKIDSLSSANNSNAAYNQANTAYNQANIAYGQANTAYGQANTGYIQANTAYGQANTARTQANTAYNQANGAFDQANAAYAQANTLGNKGHIYGLTLSNGTDTVNAIDIATGDASDASGNIMTLASILTKNVAVAWAVGTNQGGLDTGSISNTTYHAYLIQRSDTLVVDAIFTTSNTGPTMPTNYDRKRRIGSILREAGTIVGFTQFGDEFLRKVPVSVFTTSTLSTSAVLFTLTVPVGFQVGAILEFEINPVTHFVLVTSPDQTDSAVSVEVNTMLFTDANVGPTQNWGPWTIRTNTSAQIRARAQVASTIFKGLSIGWMDYRGLT